MEGGQGGLERILVTNKGDWGGGRQRKEKGRGEGGREGGWLCQYYGLQKAQGGKGNAH